jgi:hypothetical protein
MVPIPELTVIVDIPVPRKSNTVAPYPIFTPLLLIPTPATETIPSNLLPSP